MYACIATLHCPVRWLASGALYPVQSARMVALLLASLLPSVAALTSECPSAPADAHARVDQFTPTFCAYLFITDDKTSAMFSVLNNCSALTSPPGTWYLPMLTSDTKQKALARMIENTLGWREWIIWLGIYRRGIDAADFDNETDWANPSQWIWMKTNRTLSGMQRIPWAPGQPDNAEGSANWMEQCATAERRKIDGDLRIQWFDRLCTMTSIDGSGDEPRHLIVCEAKAIPRPARNITDSTQESSSRRTSLRGGANSRTTKGYFAWQWILVGVTLTIAVAAVAIIVVFCVIKRYFLEHSRSKQTRASGSSAERSPISVHSAGTAPSFLSNRSAPPLK